MKYLVIELKDKPAIVTDNSGEPKIFDMKQDAFREADKCKQGLVYPIYDIMKTLEHIKLRYTSTNDEFTVGMILGMLDEVV